MSSKREIVAVGLLTETDLDRLGPTFNRAFPLEEAPFLEDLLAALDRFDLTSEISKPPPSE